MEKLEASPFKLNETIAYQDGAVVSREILRKKTGTVTVFAFDKGQGLSEHTAPLTRRSSVWMESLKPLSTELP